MHTSGVPVRNEGRARVAVVGPAIVAGAFAAATWAYQPLDWTILHTAGIDLVGGNLTVYVQHPDAQSGPLALVVAALPRPLFVAITCALLMVITGAARRLGCPDRTMLCGGLVAAVPWGLFALEGHVDDALVVVGAALLVVGARERRPSFQAVGFVVAVGAKPTGVVLAPLLLYTGWPTIAVAMSCVAAIWLPVVLSDVPGFLQAGNGIAPVQSWSAPFMLGEPLGAPVPDWVRPVQLIGALVLCYVVAKRNGPAAAVLAAVAFRVLLEPGAWPSYSSSLIALALLLPARREAAIAAAAGSWVVSYFYPLNAVEGIVRVLLLVALVVLASNLFRGRRKSSPLQSPGSTVEDERQTSKLIGPAGPGLHGLR